VEYPRKISITTTAPWKIWEKENRGKYNVRKAKYYHKKHSECRAISESV